MTPPGSGERNDRRLSGRLTGWWFQPLPRGRVAALRSIIYIYVFVDVVLTSPWVDRHGSLPEELYQPLFLARLVRLPVPGSLLVTTVQVLLLAACALAATGKMQRLAGTAVFFLYLQWMFIAMSYGKVDHDRFAFLVALAVLPSAGQARWGDRVKTEAAGWALRAIQVAVVMTYFLAAFAKLRFGGLDWLNGATLVRAVLRRQTFLSEPLLDYPFVLHAAQYAVVIFELASPLLLAGGRLGRGYVIAAILLHLVTFLSISIIFLPHVVCLLAFVSLERVSSPARRVHRRPVTGPAAAT